jgi:ribosome-binding factor A
MPSYRPARIAELVHREVAARLRQDVKDPELGPISITRVEVPRDLGCAVVFYLPLGGGAVTPTQVEGAGPRGQGAAWAGRPGAQAAHGAGAAVSGG